MEEMGGRKTNPSPYLHNPQHLPCFLDVAVLNSTPVLEVNLL